MGTEAQKFNKWRVNLNISTVLTTLTIVTLIITIIQYFQNHSYEITIHNKLGLPIKIYTNNEYREQIEAYSKAKFGFYSISDFPVQVRWEIVQLKDSKGNHLGDAMSGVIKHVDNHGEVNIQNVYGENYFFMPIITNSTGLQCKIVVNDRLSNQKFAGFLLAYANRVNIGYYEWKRNSNVSLRCSDRVTYVWGTRGNTEGPALEVNNPDGSTYVTLPK